MSITHLDRLDGKVEGLDGARLLDSKQTEGALRILVGGRLSKLLVVVVVVVAKLGHLLDLVEVVLVCVLACHRNDGVVGGRVYGFSFLELIVRAFNFVSRALIAVRQILDQMKGNKENDAPAACQSSFTIFTTLHVCKQPDQGLVLRELYGKVFFSL